MIKIISFMLYIFMMGISRESCVIDSKSNVSHHLSACCEIYYFLCRASPGGLRHKEKKKYLQWFDYKTKIIWGICGSSTVPRDSFTPPLQVCGNECVPLCANMHASVSVWAGPNTNQCYRRDQGLHSNSVADQISVLSSVKPIISSFQHISSGFLFPLR